MQNPHGDLQLIQNRCSFRGSHTDLRWHSLEQLRMALRSWKDYIETIAIPRLHLIDTAVLALTSEYRLIGMMGGKCM